jgi:hypothetical protein
MLYPFFDFLTMISPFAAPGIAPRTNSKFSSGLDSITFNRWTVIRLDPICPGKVFPFQTREGYELAPIDPG